MHEPARTLVNTYIGAADASDPLRVHQNEKSPFGGCQTVDKVPIGSAKALSMGTFLWYNRVEGAREMMTRNGGRNRDQIEFTSLEELVPEDHLVRKLENAIDWSFIYELVENSYCEDNGRPSLDPVILIKLAVIQFMFGIRSMRQTIQEIKVNMAYRWFLGLGLHDSVPHFSTFGKNYMRRFQDRKSVV